MNEHFTLLSKHLLKKKGISPSFFIVYFLFGTSNSFPPIYGCNGFGMETVPSAFRLFSKNAISIQCNTTYDYVSIQNDLQKNLNFSLKINKAFIKPHIVKKVLFIGRSVLRTKRSSNRIRKQNLFSTKKRPYCNVLTNTKLVPRNRALFINETQKSLNGLFHTLRLSSILIFFIFIIKITISK